MHDYNATNFDGSTWIDQKGTADLSASGSVSLNSGSYNGEDAVEFNGGYLTGSISVSTPFVWFAVVDLTDNGNIQGLFGDDADSEPGTLYRYDSSDGYRLVSGGNAFEVGPIRSGQQINAFELNGSDSQARTNGSQVGTGTVSSSTIDAVKIGQQVGFPERALNGLVARMLIYDRTEMSNGQISSVEEDLNDIYEVY